MLSGNCNQKRILSVIVTMQREIDASKIRVENLLDSSLEPETRRALDEQLEHFNVMKYLLHALLRIFPAGSLKLNTHGKP